MTASPPQAPFDPDSDSELPIAAQVMDSLKILEESLTGMIHLSTSLRAIPAKIRTEAWPRPGAPRGGQWNATPKPTGIEPAQVVEWWRTRGVEWIEESGKREIRAAAVALLVEPSASILVQDPSFLSALLPRLRGNRRVRAISAAVFAQYPPAVHVVEAARAVPSSANRPRWWQDSGWPFTPFRELVSRLGDAALRGDLIQPGDLDLPPTARSGAWGEAIVSAARPESLGSVNNLLSFADSGMPANGRSVSPAAAVALRAGVRLAEQGTVNRREMATIARNRVGSPFGADAEARWRSVSDLLPRVRAWLAGEVLAIVFQHLTPPNREIAHMTEPRREFWTRFTGSVRRMWVAVTPSIQQQVQHPDLTKLREVMSPDLVICRLDGVSDQALVWMHLEGPRGVVTVVEGNANTSIRIRAGEVRPPRKWIDYSAHVTHGEFRPSLAFHTPHDQWFNWQWKARNELISLGIREDSR